MPDTTCASWKPLAALIGLGLVIGLANNLLAGKDRHLDWVGSYPPKGEPACRKHEASLAAAAAATAAAPAPAGAEPAEPPAPEQPAATAPPGAEPAAPPDQPAAATPASPVATAPVAATPVAAAPAAPAATAAPAPAARVEVPPVPAGQSWLELAPGQVKALFDRGALFIDARRTSVYEEGHVAEALSLPIWESGVDDKVTQVIFHARIQGDVNAPIVVYCNGGDCEDSHMVGDKLSQAGHGAVYIYKDGWPDWSKNGWPTAAGGAP